MKSKSIAFIVAALGATVVLNLNALAGPGPQLPVPPGKVSDPKKAITIALSGTALDSCKTETASAPKLTQVSGPHGVTYVFRR